MRLIESHSLRHVELLNARGAKCIAVKCMVNYRSMSREWAMRYRQLTSLRTVWWILPTLSNG